MKVLIIAVWQGAKYAYVRFVFNSYSHLLY